MRCNKVAYKEVGIIIEGFFELMDEVALLTQ
jgi:hypothetical protein